MPAYVWRGPFRVVRAGRAWKIVNAKGEAERLGFHYKNAALEQARLMNLAQSFCDEFFLDDFVRPSSEGGV